MSCFIDVLHESDFTIHNIPFAIISSSESQAPRAASAIGSYAIDLLALAQSGAFGKCSVLGNGVAARVFAEPTLNAFMALGRPAWREARAAIQAALSATGTSKLREDEELRQKVLLPLEKVKFHLPANIGDYTDFYASKEHATNVGVMFRGKENALMPNWVHLPVGYHGRASSVVVSGTSIRRPNGLTLNAETKLPEFKASRKLDYELEVAAYVGTGSKLGDSIAVGDAEEHIFGLSLMNDWSARDIQQYEYVPLGPFLGKNFGTTVSPWIVTLDALEPFRVAQPKQDPSPAAYLSAGSLDAYDVKLEVAIKPPTENTPPIVVSRSNLKYMYWSFKQMLAHHTVNGCNMRPGDLLGSGTISGPTPTSLGSLLELSKNGNEPFQLAPSVTRAFIEDGDEIVISGHCSKEVDGQRIRIGFGEARGVVVPAKSL
ncbi:hypothetical protein HDU87_006871 [Geranomyces variabilis]|uniref:Fumarylacetoacetase n=1 Tax=Geranomyces variabilis TaxID=109894 RepID=A0AAD5XTY2_9FUNG|nr:hypothetical protein HDU87_006871 [Geranomyces variabilis]